MIPAYLRGLVNVEVTTAADVSLTLLQSDFQGIHIHQGQARQPTAWGRVEVHK